MVTVAMEVTEATADTEVMAVTVAVMVVATVAMADTEMVDMEDTVMVDMVDTDTSLKVS